MKKMIAILAAMVMVFAAAGAVLAEGPSGSILTYSVQYGMNLDQVKQQVNLPNPEVDREGTRGPVTFIELEYERVPVAGGLTADVKYLFVGDALVVPPELDRGLFCDDALEEGLCLGDGHSPDCTCDFTCELGGDGLLLGQCLSGGVGVRNSGVTFVDSHIQTPHLSGMNFEDLVAPTPGPECSGAFLFCTNSPRKHPIISGLSSTSTNSFPL